MSKADIFQTTDMTENFSSRSEKFGSPVSLHDKQAGRHRLRNAARIEIDRIKAEEQVRKDFDEDELQALAHSLKTKGQLQPIRVRWDEEQGLYIVLMGERRFRAAQMAGLKELDCIVHDAELFPDEIHELQLIENLLRQDLNPIEEAQAYQKLKTDRGCTAKDLATELGVNATKITRSLRLLTLPADVQDQVAEGKLPPTVIREVVKIKSEEEQRELINRYLSGDATRDVIASQVKAKKTGNPAAGPKTKKSFTNDGIKMQATSKKKVTNAQIAEALRIWLGELESDGRSRKTAA